MPATVLTDLAIKALKVPEKGQTTYFDSNLSGFGVRVSPGGTKTFVIVHGGDRHRETIGRYPLVDLKTARGEAKRRLAEYTLGKKHAPSLTYEEARTLFLADATERTRLKTHSEYKRHLELTFGKLSEITTDEIERKLKQFSDRPSEKDHRLATLRIFFRWCVRRKYVPYSPAEAIERVPQPSREKVLTDEELKKVYTTALNGNGAFHRLMVLLIHIGGRRTETVSLQWTDIAPDTITFRAKTRKVRKTKEKDHTIPLTKRTKKLLETFPRTDSPYLFPASRSHRKGKPTTTMNGFSAMKEDFDKECGVSGWTNHDIRRTLTTVMCEKLDVLPHIADWIIAHVGDQPSSTHRVYNRAVYLRQAREALTKWDGYLLALAEKE